MTYFHLDWPVCQDGYRWEFREAQGGDAGPDYLQGVRAVRLGEYPAEIVIVPKSKRFRSTEPLKVPSAYRLLAGCPRTISGAMKFVNAYGLPLEPYGEQIFCIIPEGVGRPAEDAIIPTSRNYKGRIRDSFIGLADSIELLLTWIELAYWDQIEEWLRGQTRKKSPYSGGFGDLGLTLHREGGQRVLRFVPRNLYSGLCVQAIADGTLGKKHRKCKNPACDQYFAIGKAHGGKIATAEYHSKQCEKAHAYARRKGGNQP